MFFPISNYSDKLLIIIDDKILSYNNHGCSVYLYMEVINMVHWF